MNGTYLTKLSSFLYVGPPRKQRSGVPESIAGIVMDIRFRLGGRNDELGGRNDERGGWNDERGGWNDGFNSRWWKFICL